MVILTLTHMYPYPVTDGGKIVTYNTLKYLKKNGVENILLTFANSSMQSKLDDIAEVHIIEKNTSNKVSEAIKNLISPMPYNMYKYKDYRVIKEIDCILENKKIDIIYIDHLHMAIYAKYIKQKYPNIPLVIRQHNVETTIMERFYKNQTNLIIKLYSYIQFLKLKNYESKIVENFELALMLTDDDNKRMKQMCKEVKTKTIPAGVDVNRYMPNNQKCEKNSIVFLGAMNWLPNEDGILWFVENIFNNILRIKKDTKLYIVGKNPTQKIKELDDKNIKVTGFVDDDRDYIAKASVFIVPLRIGGGMRIKILNAMSMGKCIVSTTIGAEGINAENGKEIYIEDDIEQICKKIIYSMEHTDTSDKIGQAAREKILKEYSWDAICIKIEKELKQLLK